MQCQLAFAWVEVQTVDSALQPVVGCVLPLGTASALPEVGTCGILLQDDGAGFCFPAATLVKRNIAINTFAFVAVPEAGAANMKEQKGDMFGSHSKKKSGCIKVTPALFIKVSDQSGVAIAPVLSSAKFRSAFNLLGNQKLPTTDSYQSFQIIQICGSG